MVKKSQSFFFFFCKNGCSRIALEQRDLGENRTQVYFSRPDASKHVHVNQVHHVGLDHVGEGQNYASVQGQVRSRGDPTAHVAYQLVLLRDGNTLGSSLVLYLYFIKS